MGGEVMWLKSVLVSKAFWIVVGLVAIAGAGWYVKGVFDERSALKEALEAERKARSTGQALQRTATQAEVRYLDQQLAREREANDRAQILRKSLDALGGQLRACRIDADTLRVLNGESRAGAAGDPAGHRPGASGVEAGAGGSTCEALAITFDENHGRFDRVVEQLNACRGFYRDVRSRYCRETGAC